VVKSNLTWSLVTGVCIVCTGTLAAGQNQHNQSVCDEAGLIGATYGACNVYCEALDCDGPPDARREAACDRAFDRYFELSGEPPPCEPLCPCASGWLNPEFRPTDIVATECNVEISDFGTFMDLRLEGAPDENGDGSLSAAGLNTFDDDLAGFHMIACFSEHYANQEFVLSEDSGNFEMYSNFREEGVLFDLQQKVMFKSCKKVLRNITRRSGAECVVNDTRSR
jgi:hypothetical protein